MALYCIVCEMNRVIMPHLYLALPQMVTVTPSEFRKVFWYS